MITCRRGAIQVVLIEPPFENPYFCLFRYVIKTCFYIFFEMTCQKFSPQSLKMSWQLRWVIRTIKVWFGNSVRDPSMHRDPSHSGTRAYCTLFIRRVKLRSVYSCSRSRLAKRKWTDWVSKTIYLRTHVLLSFLFQNTKTWLLTSFWIFAHILSNTGYSIGKNTGNILSTAPQMKIIEPIIAKINWHSWSRHRGHSH